MELNDYQKAAMTTCMESSNNIPYMFYNLLGEVGELVDKMAKYYLTSGLDDLKSLSDELCSYGKLAKTIRKEPDKWLAKNEIRCWDIQSNLMRQDADLQKECDDIMWQLSGFCSVMGWKFNDIEQQNLNKLKSRKERNVIDGNGDNR